MKEKLSRLALSFALAIALYAAFLPTASADDVAESLHVAVDGTGAYLFSISGEISDLALLDLRLERRLSDTIYLPLIAIILTLLFILYTFSH